MTTNGKGREKKFDNGKGGGKKKEKKTFFKNLEKKGGVLWVNQGGRKGKKPGGEEGLNHQRGTL